MTYVIGIDGGGTTTTALLATRDGTVVARGQGGPSNYRVVGAERAGASLGDAINAALRAAPGGSIPREHVEAVAAGLAGARMHEDRERLTGLMQTLLPASNVSIYDDGEVALAAATCGGEGIVVVAGTGSVAFGADRSGRRLRCGGWGHIIGDEGSAYAIARLALGAAARAADHGSPATSLGAVLATALNVATFDEITQPVYGPPAITRERLAALAPLVAQCAAAGDTAARVVLAQAGEDLGRMAISLLQRLGLGREPFPVAYSGGAWKAGAYILSSFRHTVIAASPGAVVGPPMLSPAAGAALLAISPLRGGRQPDPAVVERLRRFGSRE